MTEGVKPWFASKAIWGGIASLIAGVGLILGIDINQVELTEALLAAGSTIGGLVAIVGRYVANKTIV